MCLFHVLCVFPTLLVIIEITMPMVCLNELPNIFQRSHQKKPSQTSERETTPQRLGVVSSEVSREVDTIKAVFNHNVEVIMKVT